MTPIEAVAAMSSLADRTIAVLRRLHDDLVAQVHDLSDEQLAARSGAAEWTVAQVLSHLGSGAEIAKAGYVAALEDTHAPEPDLTQGVWDRWNALTPREQLAGFTKQNAALVETLEALTPDQRENLQIQLGFLPEPLSVASIAGMRLNEAAQHAWDVRVGLDPAATLDAAAAEVLFEHFSGGLGFLLGYIGKADVLSQPTAVGFTNSGAGIVIEDQVSLTTDAPSTTATFTGETETVLRLIAGRLKPEHTPASVEVSGNVTLDELRRVFPGY